MPNTPVIQRLQTQWGMAPETAWATAVAPVAFFPVERPIPEDMIDSIRDQGLRGLPALDFGWYPGERHNVTDLAEHAFYPDDTGHQLMAIMGMDVVTGANPYTHAIGAAIARPKSYTLYDFTGLTATGQARQYPGCYCTEVILKWVSSGKFTIASKWLGRVGAPTAKASASYSTAGIFTPLQGALTLAGAANQKMEEFTLTVRRASEFIPGSGGTQDPYDILPGTIEASVVMTFGPSDETELLYYLQNTQPVFSFLFNAAANAQLTIQMSKYAFIKPTRPVRNKEYVQITAGALGISNATDVTTGGATAAPVLFKLTNTRSAAY